jgi:hypothetical protein
MVLVRRLPEIGAIYRAHCPNEGGLVSPMAKPDCEGETTFRDIDLANFFLHQK